jgi:hypothetical protein
MLIDNYEPRGQQCASYEVEPICLFNFLTLTIHYRKLIFKTPLALASPGSGACELSKGFTGLFLYDAFQV